MNDPSASVWSAFQRLATEYPDCNAVRLTLNLQRGLVSMQQRPPQAGDVASTSVPSMRNHSAAPTASTADIDTSTAS